MNFKPPLSEINCSACGNKQSVDVLRTNQVCMFFKINFLVSRISHARCLFPGVKFEFEAKRNRAAQVAAAIEGRQEVCALNEPVIFSHAIQADLIFFVVMVLGRRRSPE